METPHRRQKKQYCRANSISIIWALCGAATRYPRNETLDRFGSLILVDDVDSRGTSPRGELRSSVHLKEGVEYNVDLVISEYRS